MLTNQPPGECEGLVLPEGLVAKILKPARVYDRAGYEALTRWRYWL